MKNPTPQQRQALDAVVEQLVALGKPFRLRDFELLSVMHAQYSAHHVRRLVLLSSPVFLMAAIAAFFLGYERGDKTWAAIIWALSLGGLGASARVFLDVLKIMPETAARVTNEFEFCGRVVLGCLFATILSMTLFYNEITGFICTVAYSASSCKAVSNVDSSQFAFVLLLPFLAGYSMQLVLDILERAVQVIKTTFGIEKRPEGG